VCHVGDLAGSLEPGPRGGGRRPPDRRRPGANPTGCSPGLFEIGIELFAATRGAGYGTEALEALARYLFDEERATRLQLGTDVDNLPMRRAAEKAGFALEGVMRGFWPVPGGPPKDYALYGRVAADQEGR
jgi:RimJ/RimL family protein N-acetyltransferase